jgi:hypothetical protein
MLQVGATGIEEEEDEDDEDTTFRKLEMIPSSAVKGKRFYSVGSVRESWLLSLVHRWNIIIL